MWFVVLMLCPSSLGSSSSATTPHVGGDWSRLKDRIRLSSVPTRSRFPFKSMTSGRSPFSTFSTASVHVPVATSQTFVLRYPYVTSTVPLLLGCILYRRSPCLIGLWACLSSVDEL